MLHISFFALPTYKYHLGYNSTNVLYGTTYHTAFSKKVFVIEDEPKYWGNTSVYCVSIFV